MEDEMDAVCNTSEGYEKCTHNFSWRTWCEATSLNTK